MEEQNKIRCGHSWSKYTQLSSLGSSNRHSTRIINVLSVQSQSKTKIVLSIESWNRTWIVTSYAITLISKWIFNWLWLLLSSNETKPQLQPKWAHHIKWRCKLAIAPGNNVPCVAKNNNSFFAMLVWETRSWFYQVVLNGSLSDEFTADEDCPFVFEFAFCCLIFQRIYVNRDFHFDHLQTKKREKCTRWEGFLHGRTLLHRNKHQARCNSIL